MVIFLVILFGWLAWLSWFDWFGWFGWFDWFGWLDWFSWFGWFGWLAWFGWFDWFGWFGWFVYVRTVYCCIDWLSFTCNRLKRKNGSTIRRIRKWSMMYPIRTMRCGFRRKVQLVQMNLSMSIELLLETRLEFWLRTTQRFLESMVPLESRMEYPSQTV